MPGPILHNLFFFFFPCFENRGCPLTSKPSLIGLHGLNAIGIDNFLAWVCQLAVLEDWGDNSIGALCTCVYVCAEETELQGRVIPLHSRSYALALIECWMCLPNVLAGTHIRIIVRCFLVEDKKDGAVGAGFFFSYGDDLILSFSLRNAWANPQCWIALVQSENLKEDDQFGVDLTHCAALCDKVKLLSRATQYFSIFFLCTEKTEELSRLSNFSCSRQRGKNKPYIHMRQETNTAFGSSLWLRRLNCLKSITWNFEMGRLDWKEGACLQLEVDLNTVEMLMVGQEADVAICCHLEISVWNGCPLISLSVCKSWLLK